MTKSSSDSQWPPSEFASTYEVITKRLGSKATTDLYLKNLGLRVMQAADINLLTPDMPVDSGAPRGVEVLRKALKKKGIVISDAQRGRPTLINVTSSHKYGVSEPCVGVIIHREPVQAAVYVATERSFGAALFLVGAFASIPRSPAKPHPQLAFLVLLSERRVWVVTRKEIESIEKSIEQGKKTPCFSKSRNGIRITLPVGSVAMDLERRLHKLPVSDKPIATRS